MKKQISFDESGFKSDINFIERKVKPVFDGIVTAYNNLGISNGLQPGDLQLMILNPEHFLYDKITNGSQSTIGGIPINKQKAFEIIEKPAGCNEFIELVRTHQEQLDNAIAHDPRSRPWYNAGTFDIDNGVAVIRPSVFDKVKEHRTFYVNSEKQQNHYDKLEALSKALNNVMGLYPGKSVEAILTECLAKKDVKTFDDFLFEANARHIEKL